jgi:hypothetical protein
MANDRSFDKVGFSRKGRGVLLNAVEDRGFDTVGLVERAEEFY